MEQEKLERIRVISDEVNELHPLLQRLLDKLPNVVQVEYTHGTREMGADFVVTRTHDVLGTEEHVGVIAKTTKVAQDYSDLERQIDECAVPRTIAGGKKKVSLQEVWVITTQSISKGAQEKINHRYSTRNLQFVTGEKLASLIERYLPDFWTDVDLEVGGLLAQIRATNQESETSLSIYRQLGKSFYIEQEVAAVRHDGYRSRRRKGRTQPPPAVSLLDEVETSDLLLVEGGAGAGKSKLLRRIVDQLAEPLTFLKRKMIPLPLTFKEFMEDYGADTRKVVDARVKATLMESDRDIRFLIILDGFDETNASVDDQAKRLESLKELACDKFKILLATRELQVLEDTPSIADGISRYEIRPLSLNKVVEFIQAICTQLDLKSRIVEDLKKSELFRQLPKSPIAAILLAQLINDSSQDLPSNMTELYSKYTELMLGRWDIDKGLQSQKEYEALDKILMRLAKFMMEHELSRVPISDVQQFFEDYLQHRNLGVSRDELFDKLIRRCELVVVHGSSASLSFKHRTFAEYFYAQYLVREGKLKVDDRAFQIYWMNTYFFSLGIKKDAPELLHQILAIEPAEEGGRWLKVFNLANYFLAAYATPYDVITSGVRRAFLEAAELFTEIVSKRLKGPSERLPPMHLLYIIQYLVRNSYSYAFLRNAIEDAAVAIASSKGDDDVRARALFLLNVAYIDIAEGNTFDFMLEKDQINLPLDIDLAISHESDNLKERTALMRKHDKRVNKMMKGNRNLVNYVNKLHEVPIMSLPAFGTRD